ncbi:MAG: hypothetical protein GY782_08665 [Gammaproteobacteria bacterium]|nr:hypothetical protein [Gammaproteobacteria bacterium]
MMSEVYHCTTERKLKRYKTTGAILPPVRYWTTLYSALKWMGKTGRSVLLVFQEPDRSYPLPIKGDARWSDEIVRDYEQKLNEKEES